LREKDCSRRGSVSDHVIRPADKASTRLPHSATVAPMCDMRAAFDVPAPDSGILGVGGLQAPSFLGEASLGVLVALALVVALAVGLPRSARGAVRQPIALLLSHLVVLGVDVLLPAASPAHRFVRP